MFSTAQYYHQDALQSVVAVTDGFRNKIASYEYDVYGKIINKTGSLENEITVTGRWLDEDTGLYYYRARWYDADVGRFISRDPIGVAGGINLYGYVENNPGNAVDPSGYSSWLCNICKLAPLPKQWIWASVLCEVFCDPQSFGDPELCSLMRPGSRVPGYGNTDFLYCYYTCPSGARTMSVIAIDCDEDKKCPGTKWRYPIYGK